MIGRLKGTLILKEPPWIMLDVNGVGYEIQLPVLCFSELPDIGNIVTLFIHQQIREDAHTLFGFLELKQRLLFRQLIKISGVGPKLALTILSGLSADLLLQCIEIDDITQLTKLPGVGKKTAERLMVELRNRFKGKDFGILKADSGSGNRKGEYSNIGVNNLKIINDAISALVNLGYKTKEAESMVKNIKLEDGKRENITSEELIRLSLQQVASVM